MFYWDIVLISNILCIAFGDRNMKNKTSIVWEWGKKNELPQKLIASTFTSRNNRPFNNHSKQQPTPQNYKWSRFKVMTDAALLPSFTHMTDPRDAVELSPVCLPPLPPALRSVPCASWRSRHFSIPKMAAAFCTCLLAPEKQGSCKSLLPL